MILILPAATGPGRRMRHGDHVWGWLGQTILEQWRRFRRHLQVYAYHHELLRLPSAFPLLYVSQHLAFAPFQLPCTVTRTRVAPRTRLRQQTQTRQGHPASCRLSTTLQCDHNVPITELTSVQTLAPVFGFFWIIPNMCRKMYVGKQEALAASRKEIQLLQGRVVLK